MSKSLTFQINRRPWTFNEALRMNHMKVYRLNKLWRRLGAEACKDLSKLNPPINVSVTPILKSKRSQDTGACSPAVKAAIDGMVDAGIIPDDTPENLISITMYAPILQMASDCLVILVHEV